MINHRTLGVLSKMRVHPQVELFVIMCGNCYIVFGLVLVPSVRSGNVVILSRCWYGVVQFLDIQVQPLLHKQHHLLLSLPLPP